MIRLSIFLLISVVVVGCAGLSGEPNIVSTIAPQLPEVTPTPSTPPERIDVALGEEVFRQNCTSCHGDSGRGDGELTRTGQVSNVPDFTDELTIDSKTVSDYFATITNGNLDALMPPWRDALSEEERWAVAQYTYNLATTIPTPNATEEVAADEPTQTTPVESVTGSFQGQVVMGTADLEVPEDLQVTLHIVDREFNDQTFERVVDTDGRYMFEDIPMEQNLAYVVTTQYETLPFTSDPQVGNPTSPNLQGDITIFSTTTDPSVLSITGVDFGVQVDNELVYVVELIELVNTSDRVFIGEEGSEGVSASFTPLSNSVFADANDPRVVTWSGATNQADLVRPIAPGMQIIPIYWDTVLDEQGIADLSFIADYAVSGMVEVFVSDPQFQIEGGFAELGTREIEQETYINYGREVELAVDESLQLSLRLTTAEEPIDPLILIPTVLAIVALMAGLAFLIGRRSHNGYVFYG